MSTVKKAGPSYIHCFITIAIMIFFGMLPAPAPVTPYGMKIVGVFIGAIYGLSAVDILWGALCAIIGLGVAAGNVPGVLASALGSPLIWGILFMQVILSALHQEGVTKFIANWIISRKVLRGRPWLFSFAMQMGVFVLAMVNPIASALLFWEIINLICDSVKIERTSRWGMLMTFMTCISSGMAVVSLPVINNGLVISNQFFAVTGFQLNSLKYLFSVFPLIIFCIALLIMLCKYVFKFDVSAIKNLDPSIIDEQSLKLTGRQKALLGAFVAIVISLFIPSVLPSGWAVTSFFSGLGIFGVAGIAVLVLCILRIDGRPIMRFQSAAESGIRWAPIFMTGIIVPVSSYLMSADTGILEFIRNGLTPLLMGKSPYLFAVIIILIGVLLTNVAQNLIVVSLLIPVLYAMGDGFNINMPAMAVLIAVATHTAFLLPSAAPVAGLVHANENVSKRFIYRYGAVFLLFCTLYTSTIGYLWTNFIFNL